MSDCIAKYNVYKLIIFWLCKLKTRLMKTFVVWFWFKYFCKGYEGYISLSSIKRNLAIEEKNQVGKQLQLLETP